MEDTASLKTEIERLNNIISAFIEQATMLKVENASLKKFIQQNISVDGIPNIENSVKSVQDGIRNIENGIKSVQDGIRNNENGTKSMLDGIRNIENGTKSVRDGIRNIENGIKSMLDGIPDIENGTKSMLDGIPDIENGTKSMLDGIPDIENGTNSNLPPVQQKNEDAEGDNSLIPYLTLPALEINSQNIRDLTQAISENFPIRTKYNKKESVAAQILLLHNTGGASGNELRLTSGLSKPGWAKHFPKVRRAGFYVKAAPRKYVLTQKSKEILFKVFGGEKKS